VNGHATRPCFVGPVRCAGGRGRVGLPPFYAQCPLLALRERHLDSHRRDETVLALRAILRLNGSRIRVKSRAATQQVRAEAHTWWPSAARKSYHIGPLRLEDAGDRSGPLVKRQSLFLIVGVPVVHRGHAPFHVVENLRDHQAGYAA
jgi:hypothetical protein